LEDVGGDVLLVVGGGENRIESSLKDSKQYVVVDQLVPDSLCAESEYKLCLNDSFFSDPDRNAHYSTHQCIP
jgi:hypothetical protein